MFLTENELLTPEEESRTQYTITAYLYFCYCLKIDAESYRNNFASIKWLRNEMFYQDNRTVGVGIIAFYNDWISKSNSTADNKFWIQNG